MVARNDLSVQLTKSARRLVDPSFLAFGKNNLVLFLVRHAEKSPLGISFQAVTGDSILFYSGLKYLIMTVTTCSSMICGNQETNIKI